MAITPRYRMQRNPETGKREPVHAVKRDGTIRLDKDGKPIREITSWKVEVWGVDDTGKQRRKVIGSYTLKEDARKAERDALVKIENKVFEWEEREPEPETVIPTVKEACEIWIRLKALEVSANHLASYRGSLKNHVGPAWGDVLVTDLTHDAIQTVVLDWATEVEDEQKAKHPQTINRALSVVSGALDRQMRNGVIAANPAAGIRKPSVNKGRKDVKVWDAEQVAKFLKAAGGHSWEPAWYLAELEAMRRAEILGLRWSDIRGLDAEGGAVVASIAQTVVADQDNGGRALIQPKAKTRSSVRAVTLTQPTVEALRRHRDKQVFARKQAGDLWQDNDLVICDELGEPIRPARFNLELRAMLEGAKLPEATPHDLRHHAITRLIRNGVSPALVAQKAGHEDVSITFRDYSHLIESDQSAANEVIERELRVSTV